MKKIIGLAAFALLVGCASTTTSPTTEAYKQGLNEVESLKAKNNIEINSDGTIPSVYLGSKSMPLKTTVILPSVFYQSKRYQYPGQKFSLDRAVNILSAETGVLIRISQDAYGDTSVSTTSMPKAPANVVRPPIPPASTISISNSSDGIVLNAEKSLIGFLDSICTQAGLNWEYRNGVVVIQRSITRSLQLKINSGNKQFETSNAKTGTTQATTGSGSSGGISTGISASATVTTSSGQVNAFDSVVKSIEATLSPNGKVVPNPATGTIIVNDNIDGIERAEAIINRENELLNRFAAVRVQMFLFEENNADEKGVDWNIVFSNLNKMGGTITSPATLASAGAGSIGLSVLDSANPGKFDGTTTFIKLLNQNGKTSTVFDQVLTLRNRVAIAASSTNQESYIAATTPAPASATGATGGVVGLTPGIVTTGLDMQMLANIYDSGQLSLVFSISLLDMTGLKKLSSGTGANETSIDSPQTKGYNIQKDVPLRIGETEFAIGLAQNNSTYERNALGKEVSLLAGGSYKDNNTDKKLFVFITPQSIQTSY